MASRSPDLIEAVSAYLTMRRTAGYLLKREGKFLEDFARFSDARGQHYVTAHLAIQWAGTSTSAWVRINRLHSICLFAEYARAEEPRHEVPPPHHFGLYPKRRPAPYILTNTEIRNILHAASRLGPRKSLRPRVFETLFGLIAATGMRVSEAVALCYRDVDPAGLVVRKSKSGKGRVLPIHETTRQALDQYIEERSAVASDHDFLFVSLSGKPLRRETARDVFRQLVDDAGIPRRVGVRGPVIHSLRHTFAVRALEACEGDQCAVAEHMQAVSRYLGHSDIMHTYWYYESTPQLLAAISKMSEQSCQVQP